MLFPVPEQTILGQCQRVKQTKATHPAGTIACFKIRSWAKEIPNSPGSQGLQNIKKEHLFPAMGNRELNQG